ncbi:NAD-dependent epimerase/dehydratase family protein [Candidatus Daviesbacteria bacterium]|nr:NAD-dependent epimerase/dehydratase family protein [Candidatus Daviesbacteria bacterium]
MKRLLVTGSHGLVGSEMVKFFAKKKWVVFGIDNNTRKYLFGPECSTTPVGKELKLKYTNYSHINLDLRDFPKLKSIFKKYGPFDMIGACAGQPAHEWSTNHAIEDFELNASTTMNLLEVYRQLSPKAIFIHCSSSKVYGDSVNSLPLKELKTRYDLPKNHKYYGGVDESFGRLDGNLHSLFGASKACGDIMAGEYGHYFNLPIAIFRPVCITGSAHKGAKLHGFLAYLVKCIATGGKYIINGYKGKQVRDNIHAYDLVNAFWQVYQDPSGSYGEAYNIGGGRSSNNSILEAVTMAEKKLNKKADIEYSDQTRRGDHKWCIYSSGKFRKKYPKWNITFDNNKIMDDLCNLYKS